MRMGLALLVGVVLMAGCASGPDEGASGFPSLRDMPATTTANTDQSHWTSIETDLLAAGAAVRNDPRAQPVTAAEDPALFLEQARQELEQARQAHEPH
jgi:hypothetical protein